MKNKTSLFLLSMIVLLFLSSGKSQGQNCIDFTNFHSPGCTRTIGTFSNPYATVVSSYYNSDRHVVNTVSAGYDPNTGYRLRIVPVGESASVRLGNPSNGAQAESISYTYTVDTNSSDLLFLKYAAVLQDPGHPQIQQPRLTLEILNTNNQQINPSCTYANFYASQLLGWNTYGNVVWKDWTTVGVDLSQYHGQTIKVRMTTYDCSRRGHYGYAYIILSCGKKSVSLLNPCNSVETVHFSAPAGFNYTWYNSSNSVISHSQDIVVPADNSSYRCVCSFVGNSSCSFEVYANSIAVGNNQTTTINQTLCKGEMTDFGFIAQESGQHTRQLQSMHGCDSTVILNLTVHPTYNDTITAEICDNETYTQFGFNVSEQGVYTQHLQSIHGCDSIVTLNLLVHPTYNDTITAEICDNETYAQFGFNASEQGCHTQHLQSTHGCDSLVTLNLTVYPTFTDTTHVEICQGDRYQRDGFSAETTGIYVQNLQTTHGCDSVLVLDLVVFPTYLDTIIAETCEGIPYEQNGFYADRTGCYKQFLQTINGCDSTVVLNLRVNPIYNQDIEADICEDETYSFAGGTYSTQGVYEIRLQTEKGCDSLINLHLNVHSKYEQETDRRICQGETYIDRNFHESESGTYKAYYQSIWGCDSVIVLNLEVAPVYTDTIKAEIEYGQFYNDNGFFENERGSYVQYLTTEYGCDSIVVLWLEYLDRERKDIFAPDAITPQDEINNRFCVYPEDEEVIMEELVILNRNGAVIFSTKNFDECWNGKYKGEYVPQGVYKYMVVYHSVRTPDMKQRKIGSIMVMY